MKISWLWTNPSSQLQLVFAEALNNKDKPEDAVLDVQGIATVTPAIVQACTQDKQANFKDKVKGEWDKIKKDM
ncbi:putative periplasmic acid stress chaperone [Escherichia coli]|uniref:Putative periplasmic acid stress chaperone n=1 Tax=Escherichia coli TaxID=562 RepID=A0A377ANQ9_ECOLX|nr:putative periplasmic acid stress chaperone [Escherichia coli]